MGEPIILGGELVDLLLLIDDASPGLGALNHLLFSSSLLDSCPVSRPAVLGARLGSSLGTRLDAGKGSLNLMLLMTPPLA